jgi:hypothetical protein
MNYGGFRATFLAYLVAGLGATPVLAQVVPIVETASLPPEPPALAQTAAVESTPLPAEPPKRVEAVPPPAPARVIPGPVAASPKFNDLMTAVIFGDPKTLEQLLSLGKWPDKPDSRGLTSLMMAATLGDAASAEALLKAGANPNSPGPGGMTPISIAREREDAAVLKLLERYTKK